MLSHYFHLLKDDPTRVHETLHPPDLVEEVRARAVAPEVVDRALISEYVDMSVELLGVTVPLLRELVQCALAHDLTYHRAGAVLRAAYDPPFFATYYHGLDVVGLAFTRFAHPDRFGNVGVEE